MTNVFASDRGWLFSDLLRHFNAAGAATSHEPLTGFDSYLCIRSSEAYQSPCLAKTVVQIHCNEPRWIGSPDTLSKCTGFIYTHHAQPEIVARMGVDANKPAMMRPMGASSSFTVRTILPERFTVGWVGRASGSFKRLGLFVEAATILNRTGVTDALLVGSQLEDAAAALRGSGVLCILVERGNAEPAHLVPYNELYHQMDVLCITSSSEAGPLPLFEALACGVPVVSTRCGWAERLIQDGENGYLVEPDAREFVKAIDSIRRDRVEYLARGAEIARSVAGWTLEDWIEDCLRFTEEVCG